MDKAIEVSIASIKSKMLDLIKEKNINASALAIESNINRNYFTDLKKKKTFNITELALLSQKLEFNFFELINIGQKSSPSKNRVEKRAKVTVQIEVDSESEERKILESILDKNTVKKLLG